MRTRSFLQRQLQSESSNVPTVQPQPRPLADPQHQPVNFPNPDFAKLDLFSHAPQRGSGSTGRQTPIQAKLAIGKPNDQYEKEADRIADQVVSMPAPVQRQTHPQSTPQSSESDIQTKTLAATITPLVQRATASPEEEDPLQGKFIQRMESESSESDEEEPLQTKSTRSTSPTPSLEHQLHHSKGGGSPLPDGVRSFMEPRFGADFSQVRVHTDQTAVQMNRELGAQAFTHGNHIYYGAGKAPATDQLTGHELTHTIQQGASAAIQGKSDQSKLGIIQPKGGQTTDPGSQTKQEESPPQEKKTRTIQKSLDATGDALHSVDATALGIEKLALAFAEDSMYMQALANGQQPDDSEASEEDSKHFKKQLKTYQESQAANTEEKREEKLAKNEKQAEVNQRKQDKVAKFEAKKQAAKEKDTFGSSIKKQVYKKKINKHKGQIKAIHAVNDQAGEIAEAKQAAEDAAQKRDKAYLVRSYIYSLYLKIHEQRKQFPKREKKADRKKQKEQARQQCAAWAVEAEMRAKNLEEDRAGDNGLKVRKKKLVSEGRMAVEATESPGTWIKQKGVKTAKVSALDFAAGFGTAGIMGVEAETDNRGFMKPPKVTNVISQAKEEFKQIKTERQLLKTASLRSAPAKFFDLIVAMLQGTDRIVLGTIQRILKFLKIYCAILSSNPYTAPIFAPIGAILSLISGIINLASAAINGLIMLIRGIQAAVADPFVVGILRASAISAGIDSLTSGIKGVSFALGETGALDQHMGQSDQKLAQKGLSLALPVTKTLMNEGAKTYSERSYKESSGEMKGDRTKSEEARKHGAGLESHHLKAILDMAEKKVPNVSSKVGETNSKVDETTSKADEGVANASRAVKDPNEKEAVESTKESSTAMKVSGSSIKELLEVLKP